MLGELRRLDRRIATTAQAVVASGTTLTELPGFGGLRAAMILACTGCDPMFPTCGGCCLLLRCCRCGSVNDKEQRFDASSGGSAEAGRSRIRAAARR